MLCGCMRLFYFRARNRKVPAAFPGPLKKERLQRKVCKLSFRAGSAWATATRSRVGPAHTLQNVCSLEEMNASANEWHGSITRVNRKPTRVSISKFIHQDKGYSSFFDERNEIFQACSPRRIYAKRVALPRIRLPLAA